MRRKGYAEVSHEMIMKRQKKERRRQKMFVAAMLAIFGGAVTWIYWCLWAWANGLIG